KARLPRAAAAVAPAQGGLRRGTPLTEDDPKYAVGGRVTVEVVVDPVVRRQAVRPDVPTGRLPGLAPVRRHRHLQRLVRLAVEQGELGLVHDGARSGRGQLRLLGPARLRNGD